MESSEQSERKLTVGEAGHGVRDYVADARSDHGPPPARDLQLLTDPLVHWEPQPAVAQRRQSRVRLTVAAG